LFIGIFYILIKYPLDKIRLYPHTRSFKINAIEYQYVHIPREVGLMGNYN